VVPGPERRSASFGRRTTRGSSRMCISQRRDRALPGHGTGRSCRHALVPGRVTTRGRSGTDERGPEPRATLGVVWAADHEGFIADVHLTETAPGVTGARHRAGSGPRHRSRGTGRGRRHALGPGRVATRCRSGTDERGPEPRSTLGVVWAADHEGFIAAVHFTETAPGGTGVAGPAAQDAGDPRHRALPGPRPDRVAAPPAENVSRRGTPRVPRSSASPPVPRRGSSRDSRRRRRVGRPPRGPGRLPAPPRAPR
jgi:hypothetical protein